MTEKEKIPDHHSELFSFKYNPTLQCYNIALTKESYERFEVGFLLDYILRIEQKYPGFAKNNRRIGSEEQINKPLVPDPKYWR